jgi:SAM-dependent methyltransferase
MANEQSTGSISLNRDVWNSMFDWIASRGGRKYPDETVVMWLLGHARTDHSNKRVLDVGCGWSQSLLPFLHAGFEYWGVDVTDRAFIAHEVLESSGFADRTHLSVFEPPKLDFPDGFFSHLITIGAIHLNPDRESLAPMIAECHRVLAPKGRFLATCIHPNYWFVKYGYVNWVGTNTVEVNEKHPEVARRGARYFLFRTEDEVREYFSLFNTVHLGREIRYFGEDKNRKVTDYWIISAEK